MQVEALIGKARLSRDTVRDATRKQAEQYKREYGDLKQLVADLSLEAYRLKTTRPSRYHTTPPVSADERAGESGGAYESSLVPSSQTNISGASLAKSCGEYLSRKGG